MSDFLNTVRHLIRTGAVRVSEPGYDELAGDGLTVKELLDVLIKLKWWKNIRIIPRENVYYFYKMINMAIPPTFVPRSGQVVHVLWGIPKRWD